MTRDIDARLADLAGRDVTPALSELEAGVSEGRRRQRTKATTWRVRAMIAVVVLATGIVVATFEENHAAHHPSPFEAHKPDPLRRALTGDHK